MANALGAYLEQTGQRCEELDAGTLAFVASVSAVHAGSPEVARSIVNELGNQRRTLKMIASENYCSLHTQAAMGNLLTDKYAEGKPYQRFYAGCDNVDAIEDRACALARELFGAEHAYVQPHSGADANMVAFWAILGMKIERPSIEGLGKKRITELTRDEWNAIRRDMNDQRILALDFAAGGHLTHGYKLNVSGKMFDAYSYTVDEESGLLDYDVIEKQAEEIRPLIIIGGYSAYPRKVDFRRMREIADKVGAVLMVDMAHFAGLVAGRVFEGDYNPVLHADIVTSTTHKTLRGPRGGIVLCKEWLADEVDKGCPLVLGGPLPHVMAAKAVAFEEALRPAFRAYAAQVVKNAQAFAQGLEGAGIRVLTGGTDNHIVLADVSPMGITGYQAEFALREAGVTMNRNAIPFDKQPPLITSGLRFGTAGLTTIGMVESDLAEVGRIVGQVLAGTKPGTIEKDGVEKPSKKKFELDAGALAEAREAIARVLSTHAVYPTVDLVALERAVGLEQAAPVG